MPLPAWPAGFFETGGLRAGTTYAGAPAVGSTLALGGAPAEDGAAVVGGAVAATEAVAMGTDVVGTGVADVASAAGADERRSMTTHVARPATTSAAAPPSHAHGMTRLGGSTLSIATRISASVGGSSSSAMRYRRLGGGLLARDSRCAAICTRPSLRTCTTSSSAVDRSVIDGYRSSGFFARQTIVISSSAPSSRAAADTWLGRGGCTNMCCVRTPMYVSASKGTRPVNISYMMMPSA